MAKGKLIKTEGRVMIYMYLRVKVAEELEVKRGRTKLYYGSKHARWRK